MEIYYAILAGLVVISVCAAVFAILYSVIKNIKAIMTIYLDAHFCFSGTSYSIDAGYYPLLIELDELKKHPIKRHTILIDDVSLIKDGTFGFTLDDVKNKLLEINPKYQFSLDDKLTNTYGEFKNDILVAKV